MSTTALKPVGEILQRQDVRKRIAAANDALGKATVPALPGPDREPLLALIH